MFSKKERKVNPVLLPLLCAFATILLVLGIVLPLAAEIKHLQMIVQQQDVRIGELEKETWRGRVESLQRAEEDDISIKTKQEKLREVWKRNDVQEKQRWQTHAESVWSVKTLFSKHDQASDSATDNVHAEEHKIVKRSPEKRGNKRKKRCKKMCYGKRGRKGDSGSAGSKGEQGSEGRKGAQGSKGAKGEQGSEGRKGDVGPIGLLGQKGVKGEEGARGSRGDNGERGKVGPKGNAGFQGVKGDKGDKGKDGNVKTAELIHLVGHSDEKLSLVDLSKSPAADLARFKNWREQDKFGKVTHHDGYIRISVTGFYYVYCQIHYAGEIYYHRQEVYKNDNEILLISLDTFSRTTNLFDKKVTTKFCGGVFHLSERDKISVRGMRTKYRFLPTTSYFGLFLIHPL